MTAESQPQPRHPLALLDLLIRVNAAAQTPGEEHENLAEQFTQVMADPATGEQLRALRAQAEAEAVWKARMNHACLRLDMRARSAASVGHDLQAEIWTAAGDIVSEEYRAALAQAQAGAGSEGQGEGA